MKKKNLLFVSIALFVIFLPFNAFSATYNPGTYKLSLGQISDGLWIEYFPAGEGQASLSNFLTANGSNWAITANIKQNAQPAGASSGFDYYTVYNVLFEFMTPGVWGDSFILQNIDGENYSKRDSYDPVGDLAFNFSTSGIVDNYLFQTDVDFDSISGSGTYSYDSAKAQHSGSTFEEITLTISQVPIPATVWIFGAGVIGLVGIRRKIRS